MKVDVRFSPSFAAAVVELPPGVEVLAEASAMIGMSAGVQIETRARGGFMKSLRRSALGRESFFINTFRAPTGGEVTFAPTLPGDIVHLAVDGSRALLVQSGSWLAAEPSVDVDTKWGGGRTFFSGEGLFLLRCSGQGDMLVASYGALECRSLADGEEYRVDTGHMVAFEEGMGYKVGKVGNWKSTLLSGEGLVATFTGPGKLWMQSRSPGDLVSWLAPQLPTSSGDGNRVSIFG